MYTAVIIFHLQRNYNITHMNAASVNGENQESLTRNNSPRENGQNGGFLLVNF